MDTANIDVDDLFDNENVLGDSSFDVPIVSHDVGLLPPQPLLPVGLVQHVDDRKICGLAQRIAYSRQGCIASLTPDSRQVNIQCLQFNKSSATWGLSDAHPVLLSPYPYETIHLQWSPAGTDLVLVDNVGRLAIYSISPFAVNQMQEQRPASMDPEDGLNQPVGLAWLSQDRPRDMILQSSKDGDRWRHVTTKRKPHGPHFPRAVATITRTGTLRLIFQRPDQQWIEAITQVHSAASPDEYLTHAAFAPTVEGKLLIAVYDYRQKLAIYHVQVDWPDLRQDPTAEVVPTFSVETIDVGIASGWSGGHDEVDSIFTGNLYHPETRCLTHLEIIPTSDIEKTLQGSPTICAVYTSVNSGVSITSPNYLSSSIVRRWTVQTVDQSLHPRFDDIASKGTNPTTPAPKTEVRKVEPDVSFNQVITSLQSVDSGHALAITTQNGETQFYKPDTITQAYMENESDEVLSMSQAGFVFPEISHPLQIAFSANAASCITLDHSGTVHLSTMQYPQHAVITTSTELSPALDAALASIVLTFARASHSSNNTDDLVHCTLSNLSPPQVTLLLSQMYATLFRNVDLVGADVAGSEISQLHTKSIVPKVLSFANAVGIMVTSNASQELEDISQAPASNHRYRQRMIPARLAWLTIHLRNVAIFFYFFMSVAKSSQQQQGQAQPNGANSSAAPVLHHDFVELLCDNARWLLDLFKWMLDGLMERYEHEEYGDFFASGSVDFNQVSDPDHTENGSGINQQLHQTFLALPPQDRYHLTVLLLMGAWPKYFSKLSLKLIAMTVNAPGAKTGGPFARVAETVRRNSVAMGLGLRALEKMFDINIPPGAQREGIEVRVEREINALGRGEVPHIWETAVNGFTRSVMQAVMGPKQDQAVGMDVDRLGLFVAGGTLRWQAVGIEGLDKAGRGMDVHRKIWVGGLHRRTNGVDDSKLRVCVRCGGLNEELSLGREWSRALLQHMTRQMNRCICEGGWIVE